MLTVLGHVTFGHLLVLTLAAGTLRGLEHAARQSYTHDVVGAPALLKGLAVLGIGMRSGWLLGSLGAGAVIARFGSGFAYLAVALGFLAGGLALLPASREVPHASPNGESVWRSVLGFATAVRTDASLLTLMVLTAGAEVLGFSHQALLPSLARDVLRTGPEGLGALNAARSVGGILGLVAASARGPGWGGGALFVSVLLRLRRKPDRPRAGARPGGLRGRVRRARRGERGRGAGGSSRAEPPAAEHARSPARPRGRRLGRGDRAGTISVSCRSARWPRCSA